MDDLYAGSEGRSVMREETVDRDLTVKSPTVKTGGKIMQQEK
jgi:hypothetical protein